MMEIVYNCLESHPLVLFDVSNTPILWSQTCVNPLLHLGSGVFNLD